MNNTIRIVNHKRLIFRCALVATLLLALLFTSLAVVATLIKANNLNGVTKTVQGKIKEIAEGDNKYIILTEGEEKFIIHSQLSDLPSFSEKIIQGAQVGITVPAQQLSSDYVWILGIDVNGETLLDSDIDLARRIKENNSLMLAGFIGVAVLAVATIVLAVLRKRTPPTEDCHYTAKLAQMTANMFPAPKNLKKYRITLFISVGVMLILLFVTTILSETEENTVFYIFLAMFCTAFLTVIALAVLFISKIREASIRFYAENIPFDLNDLSHLNLKQEIKEELQRQSTEYYELHPDRVNDFANGYVVDFTQDGITIYSIPEDEDYIVDASEIFEDIKPSDNVSFVAKIPYEKLGLRAVAQYAPSNCMMQIFVLSNLPQSFDYPAELKFDLCFIYDKALDATLKKYAVKVDGLQDLLDNRKALMLANCKQSKTFRYSGKVVTTMYDEQ